MTSAQDVETSVTTNSPFQDSFHPCDQIPFKYVTPGFKPFSTLQNALMMSPESVATVECFNHFSRWIWNSCLNIRIFNKREQLLINKLWCWIIYKLGKILQAIPTQRNFAFLNLCCTSLESIQKQKVPTPGSLELSQSQNWIVIRALSRWLEQRSSQGSWKLSVVTRRCLCLWNYLKLRMLYTAMNEKVRDFWRSTFVLKNNVSFIANSW